MPAAEPVRIRAEGPEALPGYAEIPIAFRVETRFRIETGPGGTALVEEPVEPYIKDYDACEDEGPASWATRWDLSRWAVLGAFDGECRVGGAVVAWNTSGVDMLQGRDDLAVLWDLRVHPDHRRHGIGEQLFRAAVDWARERGCRELCVETQNINVPACRFYARQGCVLGAIHPDAYPDLPDEVQLLWWLELGG
ncbi:MAG: acetyl-transferase [Armatimonadetes bacterium]|nr:acetyl-transferase [Armatimonadota bacterium]